MQRNPNGFNLQRCCYAHCLALSCKTGLCIAQQAFYISTSHVASSDIRQPLQMVAMFVDWLLLVSSNQIQILKRMSKLLNRFRELGLHYNLNFSNKAILENSLLGFDALQRKLLILKRDHECNHELIDLHQLDSVLSRKRTVP